MIRAIAFLLIIFVANLGNLARADEFRPAVVEMVEQEAGQWVLIWAVPTSGPQLNRPLEPVFPNNCKMIGSPAGGASQNASSGLVRLQCDGELGHRRVGLENLTGRADALLRFVPLDGSAQTFRLTADAPNVMIAPQASSFQIAKSYFVIGVEHILFGWDHFLFVVALVLLVRGLAAVIKAITAFTIAHSATLILTTVGVAGLPQRPVEVLIALSILFLAIELTRPDRQTWTKRFPWIVAFAFGLLHGFGFAGALAEIGLPPGETPLALLTFNIGVEVGQLLIIAAVAAVRFAAARLAPKSEQPLIRFATYGIGITASYWLIDRLVF
ncbi:MAG: HupE/UreJ family protein [Erythrobacter sp.]